MKNQDVYQKDPLVNRLANNGVAEVAEDRSQAALGTPRYELEIFVWALDNYARRFLRYWTNCRIATSWSWR